MPDLPLGDSFIVFVKLGEEARASAFYGSLGYVVDTLLPPEQTGVQLWVHKPTVAYTWPKPGDMGWDESHYQGITTDEGHRQAASAGYKFVGIKLGEGRTWDTRAIDNVRHAEAALVPWLGYVEYRYDIPPAEQVSFIRDVIGVTGFPPLGLWAALEENYRYDASADRMVIVDQTPFRPLGPNTRAFLEGLLAAFRGGLIGVYSRRGWINGEYAGQAWLGTFKYWNAQYFFSRPTALTPFGVPAVWQGPDGKPGQNVLIWQWDNGAMSYSEPVPGIGKADRNFWVGELPPMG